MCLSSNSLKENRVGKLMKKMFLIIFWFKYVMHACFIQIGISIGWKKLAYG